MMTIRDVRRGAAVADPASVSPARHRGVGLEFDAFSVEGGPVREGVGTLASHRAPAVGSVLTGGIPRTTTDAFRFNDLPDALLLGWLAARGHRPNLLIECTPAGADTAMRHLMTWCALPFRYCALPGRLELPTARRGTLLLHDVAQLTLSQQVALYDWLSLDAGDMQVVSIATERLVPLVEDGRFLEGLYYRLNVIRLDAANGTRPAPLDTWQHAAARMV